VERRKEGQGRAAAGGLIEGERYRARAARERNRAESRWVPIGRGTINGKGRLIIEASSSWIGAHRAARQPKERVS
jgi:hypothetical protein